MTPSERLVADANGERTMTDSKGRTIRVRRLNALDRARLFKAMGPIYAQNPPYLGMAMLASAATEMDGVPLAFPNNDAQIESLIAILGDEGLNAIAAGLVAERAEEAVRNQQAKEESVGDTSAA